MFGYWKAYPSDSLAGWGCRAILNGHCVDFVPDRQSWKGDKVFCRKLSRLLDGPGNGLDQIRQRVYELKSCGELLDNEEKEYVLVDNDEIIIIGNTNGSCGYLYLLAYLKG